MVSELDGLRDLVLAMERTAKGGRNYSMEEVMAHFGITREDLDELDEEGD